MNVSRHQILYRGIAIVIMATAMAGCLNPLNDGAQTSVIPDDHRPGLNTIASQSASISLAINHSYSGTLQAQDPVGRPLTYSIVSQPTVGTITITDAHAGTFLYTPNTGVSGSDSFTFKASNGIVESTVSTISISIVNTTLSLSGTANGSAINLSWTPSAGAVSYRVLRGTTAGTYSPLISGLTGSTYTDSAGTAGTAYYYVVAAVDSIGDVTNSNDISYKPIAAFAATSVVVNNAGGADALVYSWPAVAGALTYTVKYSTVSGGATAGTTATTCNAITTTSCTLTGLTAGTTYYLSVAAQNAVGVTNSKTVSAELNGTPLGAFSISSAIGAGTSANVVWGASGGAASYSVVYGTSTGSYPTTASTTATSPYNLTGLPSGSTAYIMVRAVNASGSLNATSEVTVSTLPSFSISSLVMAPGQATLSWPSVSGAAAYTVKYGTATGVYGTTASTTAISPFVVTGLADGSTYYFMVTATNSSSSTSASAEVSGRSIESFSITSATAGAQAVAIAWPAVAGASSYTVKYGTATGVYGTVASTSATSPYTVIGLANSTAYYFMVTATNTIGVSATRNADAELSATTWSLPSAPVLSRVVVAGTVDLSWTASTSTATGGVTYSVARSTTSGSGYVSLASGLSATTYSDTSATSGITYYYRVTATNAVGTTNSNEVSAIPMGGFTVTAAAGSGQVTLTWSAAAGATAGAYKVEYGTASGVYGTTASTTASSPVTVSSLANGTTYYFLVTATNTGGSRSASEVSEQPYSVPTAATGLAVTASNSTCSLSWNASTSTGTSTITYTVKRSTTSGQASAGTTAGNPTACAAQSTRTCDDGSLNNGPVYYYAVQATNSVGSTWSNEVSCQFFSTWTQTHAFASGTGLSFTSTLVEIASGVARFIGNIDNSNSSTIGFGAGVSTGVTWDGTSAMKLDATSGTSVNNSELDATWAPLWSNIVGYWRLNGTSYAGTAGEVADVTGVNNGAATGTGTITSSASGKLKRAASFDTTARWVQIPDNDSLDVTNKLTVSVWTKPTTLDGSPRGVVSKRTLSGSGEAYSMFFYNGNKLAIDIVGTGDRFSTNMVFAINNWYHIVLVFDGAITGTNRVKVYVNGILDTTSSDTQATIGNKNSDLIFGALNASYGTYYGGLIDEVAIWNASLTATQVQNIYARQSARYAGTVVSRVMDAGQSQTFTNLSWLSTLPFGKPLPDVGSSESSSTTTGYSGQTANLMSNIAALWHLDEASSGTAPSSTDIKDTSGNSNHGTKSAGTVTYANGGVIGNGISMGASAVIGVPHHATLNATTKFSLSIWVYPVAQPVGNSDRIISKWNSGTTDANYALYFYGTTAGANQGYLVMYATVNGVWQAISGSYTLPLGQWTHVAFSYDSVVGGQLYINGSAYGSLTAVNAGALSTNAYSVRFTDAGLFRGNIDETALWSRDISAAEAAELYRRGANRLKFQVRTCTSSTCSDQTALSSGGWLGSDGSNQTYLSELNNLSSGNVQAAAAAIAISGAAANRYVQYRAILETDDMAATPTVPDVKKVSIAPIYPLKAVVTSTSAQSPMFGLSSMTEVATCTDNIVYQFSNDNGASWYYYNGTAWVTATSGNDSHATLGANLTNTVMASAPQVASYTGTQGGFLWQAILRSDGANQCSLDNLSITGKK